MSRVYNFSAGPAMLPVEVLKEAASEDAGLSGFRNVRDGNESPLSGIPEYYR